MQKIIEKARIAQSVWAAYPYRERVVRLKKAQSFLNSHVDAITAVIHRDNGKLELDALVTEVLPAIMGFSYYIKLGRKVLKSHAVRGSNLLLFNKQSRIEYKPYGVVGIISPWNYPFAIPFSEVVMALLAGNAVVLKVASLTPNVGRIIGSIFAAANLPAGLFNYVEIPGNEAGPAFIAGGVDKLFFTGSTAVGKQLMALAASRLLPLVLELGGADAAVICEDADLDRAAAGIVWAGFSNAGQSCGGAQRILVHRSVYNSFVKKISTLVKKLRIGSDRYCDIGPMTSLKQKQLVKQQLGACIAAGARIAATSSGGNFEGSGLETPAVVLTNITRGMPVMTEEIFGPVIAVAPVDSDEEAIQIANDSQYGLTGSVWSRNKKRARAIASRIHAGAIMINDHLMSHGLAETPWGGYEDSGIGRTHGEQGFREMLNMQVIVDDILPAVKRNIFWQPYTPEIYKGMHALTELLGGPGLADRLKSVPDVLKIFFRYWKK
ncbi:aldehyde dehydrogenase [Spirochaetia bacterium]|nr:aldehyde dehydrogenase [Spirochaetia bacterium]GHU34170.1 aldehyde dehydrogenase [Spirochaetia bacterium]